MTAEAHKKIQAEHERLQREMNLAYDQARRDCKRRRRSWRRWWPARSFAVSSTRTIIASWSRRRWRNCARATMAGNKPRSFSDASQKRPNASAKRR